MPSEPFPQAWGAHPQSVAPPSLSNASSRATRLQESQEAVQQIVRDSEAAGGDELHNLTAALGSLGSVRGSAQAEIESLQSEMAAMTLLRDALVGGSSAPSVEEVAQAMSRHVEREQLAQDQRAAPLPMLLSSPVPIPHVPPPAASGSTATSSAEGKKTCGDNDNVSGSTSHITSDGKASNDRCKICAFPMPCVKHNQEEWLEAQRQRCKSEEKVEQAMEVKGEADGKSSGGYPHGGRARVFGCAASYASSLTLPKREAPAAQQVLAVGDDEDEDLGEIDESGLDPEVIQLVMSQVGCTRRKAAAALKANSNDIVEAIMELAS